jgi:conjugal transfer pilus assembly protein TraW
MSLAAPTRFSSYLLAAMVLLSSSIAWAGEDDFFLKQLMKEQQPNMNRRIPDWLKTQPAQLSPVFEKLLKDGNQIAGGNAQVPGGDPNKPQPVTVQGKWIFVSFSMPAHEIRAAAEEAATSKSVLVFRGVEPGTHTGSITKKLIPIVKDLKPVPGAVIDPTLFTRFNVNVVPTMIETDAEGKTRIARGLPGFEWLSKQEPGDHGQRGPTFGILEPDMIEEIQRRMEHMDWDRQRREAMANFWKRQEAFNLPAAEKNHDRHVDMSIVSTQAIFHPDGRLIIARGDRINPQAIMPMRNIYIVFDATSQKQVAIAKKAGDEALKKHKPVIYLFSQIDKDRGWDHFNETGDVLNGPLYKLNQDIINRFKIQALPSVIEGEGDHVVVREIAARELH